ncbi:hypothetical protein Peur_006430 [Populus x canadensis]
MSKKLHKNDIDICNKHIALQVQKLHDTGSKKVIFRHTINLMNQMNLHIYKLDNVEFRKCINQNCVVMVWPHI